MSRSEVADSSSTQLANNITDNTSVFDLSSTSTNTTQLAVSVPVIGSRRDLHDDQKMDAVQHEQTTTVNSGDQLRDESAPATVETGQEHIEAQKPSVGKKNRCHNSEHRKQQIAKKESEKKARKDAAASEEGSDDSDSDSDSDDDSGSESSSDDEHTKQEVRKPKQGKKKKSKDKKGLKTAGDVSSDDSSDETVRKSKSKKGKAKKCVKEKTKNRKGKKSDSIDEDDDSDSESSDDLHAATNTKWKKKPAKKVKKALEGSEDRSDDDDVASDTDDLLTQFDALKLKLLERKRKTRRKRTAQKTTKGKRTAGKKTESTDYKRVDELWDSTIHNYKLKESAGDDETEFAEYAFLVRRCFTWENQFLRTMVDIKSKQLRAALAEVMKDCKSISLEAEEPKIDPNVLFLYLEELRTYYQKTLKAKIKTEKKRKVIKKLEQQRRLCKALVQYIDEDYADTKKTLYPLLEAGNITFELLWALFKPNEIAITSCYGAWDEPRCFRVDYANKFQSHQRGEWYCIEGKYLEYDGKNFGYGDFEVDVDAFKGPRKISSLATYPLKCHRDPDGMKKKIVERGERLVGMEGMQYKFHKGLAFMKKKKQVAKININGRIMIDPATFRRINPNYPISFIKPRESEDLVDFHFNDDDDPDDCSCSGHSEAEAAIGKQETLKNEDHSDDVPKYKYKWTGADKNCTFYVAVEVDENGDPIRKERVEGFETSDAHSRKFSEEEVLLASPVVLGFAFSEKLWLEFSLSGVSDITYNEDAFNSLVLPNSQKEIVRALVESHRFNAAKTIDDVIQGKGKGLVSVLHGPPGTGKTLTAEGISELLKCPLYMVSAGELGTDPARLELELQKILDIAHSWGAVLLLDEADVFLEKREVHDIHRNALVSIFLRLLEYFQGILFLTTNRVATFDEAFSSRIHLPLKYDHLTAQAKRAVWKQFIELVRKKDDASVANFSEYELDLLSRHQLNGRQIKNAVRTAQALALKEQTVLSMEHVRKVLDVSEDFDRDLKGGTGYLDAMRSYT